MDELHLVWEGVAHLQVLHAPRQKIQAKRVRDRFTFDMLKEILHHLGLSPFDEDFYLPGGAPAWLTKRKGPVLPTQTEYTLAQAREGF
jgi:hypothetical protein